MQPRRGRYCRILPPELGGLPAKKTQQRAGIAREGEYRAAGERVSIRAGQLKRNDLSGRDDAVLGESGRDSGVVGEDLEIRNLSPRFEEGGIGGRRMSLGEVRPPEGRTVLAAEFDREASGAPGTGSAHKREQLKSNLQSGIDQGACPRPWLTGRRTIEDNSKFLKSNRLSARSLKSTVPGRRWRIEPRTK